MNRERFKKDFAKELMFFSMVAARDVQKGFTNEQVEDELIKYSSSFYGARIDFDEYAVEKAYYIATYSYQIIKGNINNESIDELYDEIEEQNKVRVL